jgi:hypothetical protein
MVAPRIKAGLDAPESHLVDEVVREILIAVIQKRMKTISMFVVFKKLDSKNLQSISQETSHI